MRKLWIRWALLVAFVVALGALFIRLGEWQLHRLEWRRGNNAQVQTFEKAPVKPYQQVFRKGHTIADAEQWQRVTLTGTYASDKQVQAMYRSRDKDRGSEAVTPMRTVQGDWVLVDRGFLVRAQGAPEQAVLPEPPKGEVTVTGFVRRNEQGKPSAVTPVNGLVQLISAPEIGRAVGLPVLDGYVGLTESKPAQQGGLLPMKAPELTEGPHLSYAIQWFCFTAIAVAGVVILIRTDLKDRKKAQQKAARRAARARAEREAATGASVAPVADAATPEAQPTAQQED